MEDQEDDESPPPKRAYITIDEKIELCIKAERLVLAEKVISLKAFCRQHAIQPSQLRRWQKNLVKLKSSLEATRKKKTRLATMPGRPSRLDKIRDKLLPWIDSLRGDGKTVSTRMVAIRAKRYDSSLRRLKRYTLFATVRRFLVANGIVQRATTHVSQEDPAKKKEEATAFLQATRPLLHQSNRDKAFIINMDQTPYNPKDTPAKTLHKRGEKTVTAKTIKTGVDRITCCLTVCADGSKLPLPTEASCLPCLFSKQSLVEQWRKS